jgi:hypothetical protein
MIIIGAGTIAAGVLAIVLFVIVWQYDLFVFRGTSTGYFFVDTILGVSTWYLWYTGIVLLVLYAFYTLAFTSSISGWLDHIRYIHRKNDH